MSAGGTALKKITEPNSDDELVADCLRGREAAWSALIAKYKNLIFSIPLKSGLSQEEAADIFQAVCLDLFCQLSSIREPKALAGWLIRVTQNKCFHKHKENERYVPSDDLVMEGPAHELPELLLHEIQKDQFVRDALSDLSPRCKTLVDKLFFELPARPYDEIAQDLGLAVGSIGIIRRRCLKCLRGRLQELGVR